MSGGIGAIIAAAAQRHGLDPNTLRGIAQIESGLRPDARNPRSSAGGLFQFIDSTAKGYGLTNKFDPAANADAGARFTKDNVNFLRKRLGRDPAPGEIYMAHQQGPAGAAKILANPNASAAATVGERAFKLNGGVPGQTNAQFAQLWSNKLAKALGQPVAEPGQVPQAGTSLAEALPGVTLPTLNGGVDPIMLAAALGPQQQVQQQALVMEQRRQAAEEQEQERRRALLSVGDAFA